MINKKQTPLQKKYYNKRTARFSNKKAFNGVNHKLLIQKLKAYAFCGPFHLV